MALSGFFLGTGIAFLVALLGWGNQIKDFHNDTKRIELLFAKRLGSKFSDVKNLTDDLDMNNIQESFSNLLDSIKKVVKKGDTKKQENLDYLRDIESIEKTYKNIKSLHYKKYDLAIELTVISLFTGLISKFFESSYIIMPHKEVIPFGISILFWLWITKLIILLIKINQKEKKFQDKIAKLDKVMED